MANPFLIEDTTSTFADSNNTFNPFLTNTSADLESHNDNSFFSAFDTTNSAQDNTNPFLEFTQKSEPTQPVADLLGINEKSHTNIIEEALKAKPPPPRPIPPKRPPPRPIPPLHDAKELILSVTGEMDATSLHLLDRLSKTPSPIPMRDLLSPSPTPTADLLGCEDLQPPTTCQSSSIFDQQPNKINLHSGSKPERPKFPPKIDFLMDDLLEDIPIDEGIQIIDDSIKKRTPSIPENTSITCESKPPSRKSSNEFIPLVRRLSHDVTESRKIMPDLSKIADRRKSDIGHFAPILPAKKLTNQNDQLLQEELPEPLPETIPKILSNNTIQEINESEEKPNDKKSNNVPELTLLTNNEVQEQNMDEVLNLPPPSEIISALKEEKIDNSQEQVESFNLFEINSETNDTNLTKVQPLFDLKANENIPFKAFNIDSIQHIPESFQSSTDDVVKEKFVNEYDEKLTPPVPDTSPFQEDSSQETIFNTTFETSDTILATPFYVKDSQQLGSLNPVVNTVSDSFSELTENDAFDAFAAKFDDSQNDLNVSGRAFDAFGGIPGGVFDNSAMGFGADDNFDSFLSTHQIPVAPQSTPAKVTRNNSGESLDDSDFNIFIR